MAFKNYETRFIRQPDGVISMHPADEAPYRGIVLETTTLLNDALGVNNHSTIINRQFRSGIDNYLRSPSIASVRNIISTIDAALKNLERNPNIVLQKTSADSLVPGGQSTISPKPARVFIGHGHSAEWITIKEFIKDRLNLDYDEFNREPSSGKSFKERLLEMLNSCNFAIIVMTAEDETVDRKIRARENVVHEAGLFQGKLGFENVIILREDSCKPFSNIDGLVQVPYPKGRIMAASEEIRRTLEREGLLSTNR
jgi:predicted nucleotide-binding protein